MDALQDLGQEGRLKHIKTARVILIAIGVLTLGLNGFLLMNADNEVDEEVAKVSQGGNYIIDEVAVEQARKQVKAIYSAGVVLGIIFIALGVLVMKYPVPCTVSGLVLYIAGIAGFAMLDPATILSGIILKVIFIVCLVKAVQAAIAYQRQERNASGASV